MPPSVLVSILNPRRSEEIATISIGIRECVLLFDMWRLLQGRHLGVQSSSIYAVIVVMMESLVFHTTVTSVVEFCVSRVAVSNFEKYDHKFDEAGPSDD